MDNANPTRKDNGVESKAVNTIILAFTSDPWHLDIKATVENYDQALAMLDQARRWFETQLRAQAALQLQQQMAEQARAAQIAASMRGGRA